MSLRLKVPGAVHRALAAYPDYCAYEDGKPIDLPNLVIEIVADLRLGQSRVPWVAGQRSRVVTRQRQYRERGRGRIAMRGQRRSQVLEQDKGLRRSRRNSAPGRPELSATLKPSYSVVLVRRWPLIAALIGTATAWTTHAVGFRLNASPSGPRSVYRTVAKPPAGDTLVAVCVPAGLAEVARQRRYLGPGDCPGGVQAAIKRVVAVPGDVVDVEPSRIRVNDRPVPDSATAAHDSRGRVLAHMPWDRHVGVSGEVWLLGTHDPRSWDIRYFGALNAAQVRTTLQPVLILD